MNYINLSKTIRLKLLIVIKVIFKLLIQKFYIIIYDNYTYRLNIVLLDKLCEFKNKELHLFISNLNFRQFVELGNYKRLTNLKFDL